MNILFVVRDIGHHSPIGVMQLGAVAREKDHRTFLAVLARENVFEKIAQIAPDLIAYSGCTGEHKYFAQLNRRVKRAHPDVVTIMGGPHATFFPEQTLDSLQLDGVCVGEGDRAFADVLERVARKRGLGGLRNVLTPDTAGHSRQVELHPLVQDLDQLPFPDRDLVFQQTENGRMPIKNFMVSRGCPYSCAYCFNKAFREKYPGQRYVRRHSVDYVIAEIRSVQARYPLEYVKFYDDIFAYRVDDWLEEFAEKYRREVNLPFYCLTRADLLTEGMARLLKSAGCRTLQMAAESVNDEIRNRLLARKMTKLQLKQAFALCGDLGITVVTNYILGLPTSTVQDDVEAVYFNIEAGVPVPEFPIFQPYPQTPLGTLCIENGWFDGNLDSIHMSYNHRSPLSCFSEEQKDIQRNIAYLGQLANTFARTHPSLTELVMKHLIYQPTHQLLAEIYTRHKWELYDSLVYPLNAPTELRRALKEKSLALGVSQRTDEQGICHVEDMP